MDAMDPEIEAMAAVAAAISGLGEDARLRVLKWSWDRFLPEMVAPSDDVSHDVPDASDPPRGGGSSVDQREPAFFAELFADADPKSEADKALVAAYWLQRIQGKASWQAAEAQRELKDLGYAIKNISDAFTANIRKRPQLVIQLQKSGSSRQARKTYKVTQAGIDYVDRMRRGEPNGE